MPSSPSSCRASSPSPTADNALLNTECAPVIVLLDSTGKIACDLRGRITGAALSAAMRATPQKCGVKTHAALRSEALLKQIANLESTKKSLESNRSTLASRLQQATSRGNRALIGQLERQMRQLTSRIAEIERSLKQCYDAWHKALAA